MTEEEIYKKWRLDPFLWLKDNYGLTPQKKGDKFKKGEHISWQQAEILQSVKNAVNGKGLRQISIKSGHSIGKSVILSYIILWFMYCYRSKVGLTAPDAQLLYDVLWAEVGTQLNKLPHGDLFEKTGDHLYLKEDKDGWFARCKTGKKENPEALAGLHSENIMLIGDEASGIPEQIFEAGQSNLTGENYLFILIGNPLRNVGYFYDTFRSNDWINFSYSTLDSPFGGDYSQKIANKYGIESDEYRRRVLGEFPREDILDEKGFVQLILEKDIKYVYQDESLYGTRKILGVDCAGGGKDKSTWVLRDNNKAVIVGYENISDERSIAQRTLTIMHKYKLSGDDIVIDNFGKGANVAMHLALLGVKTKPINVGDKMEPSNGQKFKNIRAGIFWKLKHWLESGGLLAYRDYWKELLNLRYKRTLRDEIQIMSKEEMRKMGYSSPDFADALSMTFFVDIDKKIINKNRLMKPKRMRYNPITGQIIK